MALFLDPAGLAGTGGGAMAGGGPGCPKAAGRIPGTGGLMLGGGGREGGLPWVAIVGACR